MDRVAFDAAAPGSASCSTLLPEINHVGFNQDGSCLAVAGRHGFAILDTDTGRILYREEACGPVRSVEMLFQSSIVALVGGFPATSWEVTIWNTKDRCSECKWSFLSEICSVHLNHRRAVVLLRQKIHIFDLKTMKALVVIDRDAPPAPAVASLCADSARGFLATPLAALARQDPLRTQGSEGEGLVSLVDSYTLQAVTTVLAHKTPVQALCLSLDGKLLATASTKGTVIRVFGTPSLAMLYTFRRATSLRNSFVPSRNSFVPRIFGLSFAPDASHVVAAAASGTVHVFQIAGASAAAAAGATAAPVQQAVSPRPPDPPTTSINEVGGGCPDEELSDWNIVSDAEAQPAQDATAARAARLGRHFKALSWKVVQACKELADVPGAHSWVRLRDSGGNSSEITGASLHRSEVTGYMASLIGGSGTGRRLALASQDGILRLYGWGSVSGEGEARLLSRRDLSGCQLPLRESSESSTHLPATPAISEGPESTASEAEVHVAGAEAAGEDSMHFGVEALIE